MSFLLMGSDLFLAGLAYGPWHKPKLYASLDETTNTHKMKFEFQNAKSTKYRNKIYRSSEIRSWSWLSKWWGCVLTFENLVNKLSDVNFHLKNFSANFIKYIFWRLIHIFIIGINQSHCWWLDVNFSNSVKQKCLVF